MTSGTIASSNQTIIQNKINNCSIIYQFSFGEKSILFPGDIEEDGWAEIKDCIPFLNTTTYYCVSHHGSVNGYIRTTCPSPCRRNISNVRFCCSTARIAFVQGRNGAFPGIMNQSVLNDLSADHGIVHRTDRDRSDNMPHFFEINWQNDRVTYY